MEGLAPTLLITAFILGVLSLAIVLLLIPVLSYLFWRYVLGPWKVMRTDIIALNQQLAALQQQARIKAMSDEDIARAEFKLNARQKARMEGLR